MMDLFRIPSVKRRRRRESTTSTLSPPPLRTSTSLPDLVNLDQPFFIPDEDFDLAQLRAKSKLALLPATRTHLPATRPNQSRSVSTPVKPLLVEKEETVLGSPFETVNRPVSTTSRRSSTFSNTTTGPTPEFFAHQKSRRSFTSVRTAATTYTLSEAHKAEMNKLRKGLQGGKRSEPLECDLGYVYPEGYVGAERYRPLAIQALSVDMDIGLNESDSGLLSKSVSLKPVFHEGYQLSRDFRVSPSAEVLAEHNEREGPLVHHASPLGSPISENATSSEESGTRRSILDRPRKSMIFNVPKGYGLAGDQGLREGTGGFLLPATVPDKAGIRSAVALKGRKGRELFALNIVVSGAQGIGKSSLTNTIFTIHSHPHLATHLPGLNVSEESSAGSSSMSPNLNTNMEPFPVTPDGTRNFSKKTVVLTVETPPVSNPTHSTKRFSRHPAKPTQSLHPITIVDTPGLPHDTPTGRDLAVKGLENLIESKMAEKLRQERSIQRLARKGGFDCDGLIHLVLYMIDPLSVLRKPRSDLAPPTFDYEPADSLAVPLQPKATDAWKPQLRQSDLSAILRLSRRTTVLPIIGCADILTTAQRATIKQVVWRDLLVAGLADSFSIMEHLCQDPVMNAERESLDVGPPGKQQQHDASRGETAETSSDYGLGLLSTCIPFFWANPEKGNYTDEHREFIQVQHTPSFVRKYGWGEMDVLASKFSDAGRLYSGVLSKTFASALAIKTAEEFYEDYRSEQLALHQDRANQS